MKTIKIDNYKDLEKIVNATYIEFKIDLQDCELKDKKRVVDFLAGLTCKCGSLKKLSKEEFEVKIASEKRIS